MPELAGAGADQLVLQHFKHYIKLKIYFGINANLILKMFKCLFIKSVVLYYFLTNLPKQCVSLL